VFQSDHACAAFHAASRAICGGPVYVSDSLGGHDFELLRRLVFPDSTVPRCLHYALPTRDCMFKNPLFDQETVLKIWNLNKVSYSVSCSLSFSFAYAAYYFWKCS
jgi:stachyose synthetase